MDTHIKNLQDNALLYELSLAVGNTLDTYGNCLHFLEALNRLVDLGNAAVWLQNEANQYELFCFLNHLGERLQAIPSDHFISQKLNGEPYFSIPSTHEEIKRTPAFSSLENGELTFFKLSNLGFLQLYFPEGKKVFSEGQLIQLKEVVQKFAISLEGCEAHRRLIEETEQRDLMQKALKKVNKRVKASENKLRQIIDYSLDAVVNIDTSGKIVEWSKQAERMFGILKEEAIGAYVSQLIVPKEHRDSFEKSLSHFRQTGQGALLNKRIEITALRKGKKPFPVELSISVLRNEDGDLLSGFVRDISEKKKAEKALDQAQFRLTNLISNLQAGVLLENENREIVLANHYFCEVFRIPSEPAWLVGKSSEDIIRLTSPVFKNPATFLNRVEELPQNSELVVGETMHLADGRILELDFVPLFSDEKYLGQLWQYRDVTQRWKAQKEAEQARLAERQFLANMSHEIRTPMNAVIGMSHLLGDTKLTEQQKDYLSSLRFSADSLMDIINDILDLSKIEANELEFEEKQFDLAYLLESVQRTFQFKVREKAISVDFELDSQIENLVIGDPTRLNQILTNLLGNASKFTKRGTIGLKTNLLKISDEEYLVEFQVFDSGIGIAPENLNTIFQNFKQADVKVTRKFGGTGLGLTIVKQLVERQGGSIRVESELGVGSRFIFTLPLKNSGEDLGLQPVKKKEVRTDNSAFFKGLHILVAEDNRMNQKLITQILQTWGCEFHVVNDGAEALLISRVKKFDLILMDLHMPEMDGVEATEKIRRDELNQNQKTPIIALTAAALLEEKKRALAGGMNDFLTKPFLPQKLEACIICQLKSVDSINASEDPSLAEHTAVVSEDGVEVNLKYLFDFSNGDRHFVTDMVETYLRETPQKLEALADELSAENWEKVRSIVHAMKPNFMMLGMEDQRACAAKTESLLKTGNFIPEQINMLVEALIAATFSSFQPLKKELASI